MNTTELLVDGLHGINAIDHLIDRYTLLDKHSRPLPSSEQVYAVEEGNAYIELDGLLCRVEYECDIYAIHPEAVWCSQCDRYEMGEQGHLEYIGSHFLVALINGDYSGLNDQEEASLDSWIDSTTQGQKGHWSYDRDNGGYFTECAVTGMMATCSTVEWIAV